MCFNFASGLLLQEKEREASGQQRFEHAAGEVAAMRNEVAVLQARLEQRDADLARQSEVSATPFFCVTRPPASCGVVRMSDSRVREVRSGGRHAYKPICSSNHEPACEFTCG